VLCWKIKKGIAKFVLRIDILDWIFRVKDFAPLHLTAYRKVKQKGCKSHEEDVE
jgi:hypothetical protein